MSQFLLPGDSGGKALIALIRTGRGDAAIAEARERVREIRAEPKLGRKQLNVLRHRLRDAKDPKRFVVVSSFLGKWAMVYDVADNVYCHQYISEGCLIKDRRVAEAIVKSLESKRRRSELNILAVQKTGTGYRALEDIPASKYSKRWRPSFRTPKTHPTFVPITEPETRGSYLDAMIFAVQHHSEILGLVSKCKDRPNARQKLVRTFRVSERQAETILDLRLYLMTKRFIAEMVAEMKQYL
jgi:hypothetical protein